MKTFEKVSTLLRHSPLLKRADWLWNPIRPIYQNVIGRFGHNGLERILNGSDRILVSPRARATPEHYEPDVWHALMRELRPGDTFVDVGAFIGLYTIAVGLRLLGSGRVISFEPDPSNFALLREHVRLNRLEGHVKLQQAAVSDASGQSFFSADGSCKAQLMSGNREDATIVDVVSLDQVFGGSQIDVLKIDVEGNEEWVLRGASKLLRSPKRKPRVIFIEVHPYAWESPESGSESMLSLLSESGYRVESLAGQSIDRISQYGEIVARSAS